MKVKLTAFLNYLAEQVGQPYVWGGQHTKLTPENFRSVIEKKEENSANRAAVIAYCEARFAEGKTVLYAYDCSGLGMYYLQNVTGVFDHDLSANGMLGQCEAATEPKCGYWVFRLTDGKATHIGYMVSDTEVIHAKGRAYGVVREPYKPSYWHRIGKPKCIEFEEPSAKYVRVKGNVRVRCGNGTAYRQMGTAHKGDLLPYRGQAEEAPHWYRVDYNGRDGWISSLPRYTEVVER
ncbi:MAG: C40 family peptidase [Clostridia bacterium]|nr:C40 family peptidase [Clostridia bacterium]